eukprot:748351-Hanusia_phi.AAC.1
MARSPRCQRTDAGALSREESRMDHWMPRRRPGGEPPAGPHKCPGLRRTVQGKVTGRAGTGKAPGEESEGEVAKERMTRAEQD